MLLAALLLLRLPAVLLCGLPAAVSPILRAVMPDTASPDLQQAAVNTTGLRRSSPSGPCLTPSSPGGTEGQNSVAAKL